MVNRLFATLLWLICGGHQVLAGEPATLHITSPAFAAMANIPAQYTCQGADISPPLQFSGLPKGTKSLLLIVDDPDAPDPKAPKMTWVHWLLYNLPPDVPGLTQAVSALPGASLQGSNSWHRTGFDGPCPPIGRHRYFFKLYALDTLLPDLHAPDKSKLESAMQGHVLKHAALIGTYQKH